MTKMPRRLCALFGLLTASSWAQDLRQTPCTQDAEIGELQQSINSAAMNLVDALLRGDSAAAFSDLSEELRQKNKPGVMAEQIRLVQQFGPKNAKVQHTYLIKVGKPAVNRVVCAAANPRDLNARVSLSAKDVPEQAHVLISADTVNNQVAFTIWMLPENDEWKVQGLWFNVAALADQGPTQLLEKARAQNRSNHPFNTALLYVAAAQAAYRGPDFQIGIAETINEDMSHMVAPREIQGPPPFSWREGEKSWKILSVGPIAVGGKIYVTISHEVSQFQTESEVDGWNKDLLSYFKNRFPEYSDVFSGVVVRAHERGTNRGYGTVEELPATR
jgi:hypothetical protein